MIEQRKANIQFPKSGSGSISPRICIPKKWTDMLSLSKDNSNVILILKENEIIIKKL